MAAEEEEVRQCSLIELFGSSSYPITCCIAHPSPVSCSISYSRGTLSHACLDIPSDRTHPVYKSCKASYKVDELFDSVSYADGSRTYFRP